MKRSHDVASAHTERRYRKGRRAARDVIGWRYVAPVAAVNFKVHTSKFWRTERTGPEIAGAMAVPDFNRTLRAIGVAIASGNKAVDLALVETDGATHVRLVESERQPLRDGPVLAAVVHATRAFMGDRTLQPFAIDTLALAAETPDVTADGLGRGVETHACCVPEVVPGGRGNGRAERAAFDAIAAFVAQAHATRGETDR